MDILVKSSKYVVRLAVRNEGDADKSEESAK